MVDTDGGLEGRDRDLSWDGMAEEMARLQGIGTQQPAEHGEADQSPPPESIGGHTAVGPGTEAGAGVGQMMLMGPEEEVGGDDTTEQGSEEEGGDTSEEEGETGWEASQMEQEGCKSVALSRHTSRHEQAPMGFLFLTAEEKAATAMQVKRSLADPKAVSMLSQSIVVAEAVSRRSKKEQERRLQGGAAGSPINILGMQNVGGG